MDRKARRKPQQRALETRAALLDTAVTEFSQRGYDGVSLRQLEERAGTNRGLAAYHFGDKEALWHAAVDQLFTAMEARLFEGLSDLGDRPALEAARAVARVFISFSAANPALNRLMMQESLQRSWRVTYLVEEKIRPLLDRAATALPEASALLWGERDPHRYYLLVGAAAYVFSAEEECRELFGVSPRDPDFIQRHTTLVLETLLPA